jgi:cell division protein FtsQ
VASVSRKNISTGSRQSGALLGSMLLLVLLASGVLLFADYLLQPDKFPISRVSFVGDFRHIEKSELQAQVSPFIGKNFFAIDLQKLEKALRGVDWVSDVSISRRWPETLQVNVKEQRLIASWNDKAWVTSDLTVVEMPGLEMKGVPLWSAPDGTQTLVQLRYQQFSDLLNDIGLRIERLTYSQRGAWKLVSYSRERNEQLEIQLGRREMTERLYRFVNAYAGTLGKLPQRIVSIDLRYPNGFAVKWTKTEEGRPVTTG